MFRLYREPEFKEFVVIGADPADGGSDYCAAVAKSRKYHDSFMTYNGHMDSAQFGYELHKMAMFIQHKTGKWPIIGVERNTGMATISVLVKLNYPGLFRMPEIGKDDPNDSRTIGWITNRSTRPRMLDDLGLVMQQRITRIPDDETVRQLMKFVRNQKTGNPEAARGAHDDLVIAEAISEQLLTLAKDITFTQISSKIAEFPRQEIFDENGVPTV